MTAGLQEGFILAVVFMFAIQLGAGITCYGRSYTVTFDRQYIQAEALLLLGSILLLVLASMGVI